MEETITTDLYMASGYVSYGERTENECLILSQGLMVFPIVCMGISFCGLVGNGLVMWFLGSHMKQNPFIVYILNLAVADFSLLLLFFLVLLAILSFTAICTYLPSIMDLYMFIFFVAEFLCHFFDLSSLGLLTAISMERCISVLFPIWYRCHRPKHLSGVVSGVIWAFAGFFVSSMYLTFTFAVNYETVFAGVGIAIAIFLSSMMLISNLFLFIKLRCGSRRRHLGKLYVAVFLNVIFFFALGIPFTVQVFLSLPRSHTLLPENAPFLLALLNCSINPVIYFLVGSCRRRRFQASVKIAFHRVFEVTVVSKEDNHVPEDTAVETAL